MVLKTIQLLLTSAPKLNGTLPFVTFKTIFYLLIIFETGILCIALAVLELEL